MANDPQARRQSNSALIIGLIGLALLGGAALAYFATRGTPTETQAPVVVQGRTKTIVVEKQVPAAANTSPAPTPVVITQPGVIVVQPGTASNTRNTTVVRGNVPAPASSTTTTTTTTTNAGQTAPARAGSTGTTTANNTLAPRTSVSGTRDTTSSAPTTDVSNATTDNPTTVDNATTSATAPATDGY